MRRYIEIYSIMLRNSLIRELSFKANFLLWMVVEVLWFCGQIVFFSIIFSNVDRIGDWTKWEVVLLIGTHQMIAQLFQAFFFASQCCSRFDINLALPGCAGVWHCGALLNHACSGSSQFLDRARAGIGLWLL